MRSHHARDEGQRTGVLPASHEPVTRRQIPADSHIDSNIVSRVDGKLGGAHAVHGGLKTRGSVRT